MTDGLVIAMGSVLGEYDFNGDGVGDSYYIDKDTSYKSEYGTQIDVYDIIINNKIVYAIEDPLEGFRPSRVSVKDYDDDGDLDIMIGDEDTPANIYKNPGAYTVLFNDGNGNFEAEDFGDHSIGVGIRG